MSYAGPGELRIVPRIAEIWPKICLRRLCGAVQPIFGRCWDVAANRKAKTIIRQLSGSCHPRGGDLVMEYDPLESPDPRDWIGIVEVERIKAVLEYHIFSGKEVPNERLHALFHVVVENQLALGERSVLETLGRLLAEGLDRHDAIHAIGSVLSRHMYDMLHNTSPGNVLPDSYYQELAGLTAVGWRDAS